MKAKLHVLISGAGIAGPALAYWLGRHGFTSSVVERAPALRTGGQAVDFRGPVHRNVLERMDLWDAIHERQTHPGDLWMLGATGEPFARLPQVMTGGDVEILRGDLVGLLHQRSQSSTEYLFDDRVVAMEDRGAKVAVELERGGSREFDLVIGADGLHSGIRALAFRDDSQCLVHHGYRLATFALPRPLGLGAHSELFSHLGRAALVAETRSDSRALFVYSAGPSGTERHDLAAQKQALRNEYASMKWRVPELLDGMDQSEDLYVDGIASVKLERYSKGRIALIGDAAYGATLGGQGTALGIIGAYVLAGELAASSDVSAALARYEARMRPYATRCQKGAKYAGGFFAPKTRLGMLARNAFYWFLTTRPMLGVFERMVKSSASDFALPEYAS